MRPTFDRRLWILLFIILVQCTISTKQQNIKPQNSNHVHKPAEPAPTWRSLSIQSTPVENNNIEKTFLRTTDDNILSQAAKLKKSNPNVFKQQQEQNVFTQKCAKNCLETNKSAQLSLSTAANPISTVHSDQLRQANTHSANKYSKSFQLPLMTAQAPKSKSPAKSKAKKYINSKKVLPEHAKVHIAHRSLHKEVQLHRQTHEHNKIHNKQHSSIVNTRIRRATERLHTLNTLDANNDSVSNEEFTVTETTKKPVSAYNAALLEQISFTSPSHFPQKQQYTTTYYNESISQLSSHDGVHLLAFAQRPFSVLSPKTKRSRSTVTMPVEKIHKVSEPMIIIDDGEEFDSGNDHELAAVANADDKSEDYSHDEPLEPRVLPLRPVPPNPYEDEEMSVVYAEQHSEIRLMCEVDLDIAASMWYKNGQVVHAIDRTSRATDYRFIKEANGALTITNVMLEDDGKWQCEAENTRRYTENARPVKLVVLDRPKSPYLLIDSRRLDAGNIFVPVKENSELNLACVSEGGNPKPLLTWEVLLSPGVDRHAQKVSAEVLELEEIKSDKDKIAYKINGGAKSEARLPAVYRAHHNARILCVMEHPTLKIRQNASLLLDVQYTPSFAISRTPGFGYPLREGIEVSLKCDVDSNPPSTPLWQKDDGDTPVPQTGDGFLNFTSIRREHSGWYKCTSRHLNFQYSSIGYYLSVRYDSVDVTSEPDDQDISVAAASHNPNKGQLEVQLGGAVTLQCPQGSLGCWSHLDPVTARLRGLGHGLSTPTGQFSLKDVVYQDAGTYKCIGQSPTNKKKLEVLQTVGVLVKGAPTVVARNATPVAYPGSPLHLSVEFCANPPAHAARWLHGERVYTPGNQYGSTILAYGVTDLPTPYCKEARLTYVSMHERVPRIFYFIVSSPAGAAEAIFKVNFTMRYRAMSNSVDDEEEELSEPEEIHFPVFGAAAPMQTTTVHWQACGFMFLAHFIFSHCKCRQL